MKRITRIFSQSRVQFFVLLIFCALLFVLGVGRWDLWDPDEPRYAEVAKEMVGGKDWILPHLNGKVYADKPPLFFWLIALSSLLWGNFSSFAVRFPPALFGTLTVLLTFLIGKKLYSSRTGFLSGLILATSFEFAYLSTRANIDTTLTFFTTASMFCFLLWFQQRRREASCKDPMDGALFVGFYVGMALATLTKGPVGVIIPLVVVLTFLAILKDWNGIKEMKLLPGMLLFLAIVLSWYIPAVLSGGKAYLQETLFRHTVDAYAKGWTHVRPFYYYFVNFPIGFLPWVFFLPGVAIFLLLAQRWRYRATVCLLIVITVGLGFFYGTRFIFPKIDPFKSARFLSEEILQVVKPGENLAIYGGFAIGPYNFYTGIVPIVNIESAEEFVKFFRSKERVFCLIQNQEYEALRKVDLGISLSLVLRRRVGGKNVVLLSNR